MLVLVGYPLALGWTAWTNVNRTAALGASGAGTPGRTYLVVGSDSRTGLSAQERRDLHTGKAAGQRTDTIVLLHVPAGGGPTVLISVPRDSYVAIPGHDKNKINAAFAFGGPALLARTIEGATGLTIDDYVETSFAGFAGVVDALGGVQICPKKAMKDKKAGLNIPAGCQDADGKVALGYARARYSDPRGDLGRVERQRELMKAISSKGMSPSTLINPFEAFPFAAAGGRALTVDDQTGPMALGRFLLGMRSASGTNGVQLTVPVRGTGTRGGASVVLWDRQKALQLFHDIKADDTEAVRAIAEEQKKQAG